MRASAHACIDRAVTGRDNHAKLLLRVLEDLRVRSAPERLPRVMEGLGDACSKLDAVWSSQDFRLRVGDAFANMPPLGPGARAAVLDANDVGGDRVANLDEVTQKQVPPSLMAAAPAAATDEWKLCELREEVYRVSKWKNDRRALQLTKDGKLYIFQKGSVSQVKRVIDIATGIEKCELQPGGIRLSLWLLKLPAGPVPDFKEYFFEFRTAEAASMFHERLQKPK
eukprot:gnl/TRDRNA2_/TRDRNA2_129749_c0_seq3.p1 gnl/TRDRNA2_/TRDRNA2_129749_c0~~gnl/TRDRNA2_/TRDRNA2_129749_c0_seq3.p1  ORF type:complete len:225 (-),score=47.58 gnl/TRDRNA2_/TRDRNA2_129749_c0_seq3:54-728(-)